MPLDGTLDDIEKDFEILEAVGRHVDHLVEGLVRGSAIMKTLRRWLNGHAGPPERDDAQSCLMAMAADLELFTPSMSGRTAVDRHLGASRPNSDVERQALQALGGAQFRLVRIVGRESADEVRLEDLVTGESLQLLDARIAPEAAGLATAMRLCPLASGRHVLISPLFATDETMLAAAMTFVRAGRPLGHGHRCAASLYRDVARRGFVPIPQRIAELDEAMLMEAMREIGDRLTEVEHLAIRWIAGEEADELVHDARRLASVSNLVDACGFFGQAGADAPDGMREAFERIAELQMETIVQRARTGLAGQADALDAAASEIAAHVAGGAMNAGARDLFERLRARWAFSASARPAERTSSSADLDRTIQRIRALRAKTVDRGCTEEEAIAAAAKVAQLLDQHDLTLDQISVRQSDCEGASIATGRKRRGPVDFCMRPLAEFCDCRVWIEQAGDGTLSYIFFGLKADVEAARFLHELIEATFETESATFRRGNIYLALRGGDRRTALNSFQTGLGSGIAAKLATLKAARHGSASTGTGFDLVAAKYSVVDEEVARLGLNFTTRTATKRRYVHRDAYAAGKAAGALFEPNASLPA